MDSAAPRNLRVTTGLVALAAALLAVALLAGLAPDRSGRADSQPAPVAGDNQPPSQDEPATAAPSVVGPHATPTVGLTLGLPNVAAASDVEPAPLGTYVVARQGAGVQWFDLDGNRNRLEIAVYDTPFGPPRRLLDVNAIDGVEWASPLVNWQPSQGALVLRVIAGGPDDDWLMVQVPVRPNNSFAWVKRSDFEFGFTSQRIEIDLAGEGELRLIDGAQDDTVVLRSAIVQGRESRETPTHLTFLKRGVFGASVSPAYGTYILSMASFSESLGTFGGGGLPSNFLHGTNQPGLMGQRLSSGEIRVPNGALEAIVAEVLPGTPILLFDSSSERPGRASILARPPEPASTTEFLSNEALALPGDSTRGVFPHLWSRCESEDSADPTELVPLLCRSGAVYELDRSTVYLEAKPGVGVEVAGVGHPVVPVYDEPGGEPRMLVDWNEIDSVEGRVPLRHPDRYGGPLVLWPLESSADGEWFRVQAPVRPNRSSIWVRAADFEVRTTDLRLEIDLAGEAMLTLFDGDEVIVTNGIVWGKESRPTVLGVSRIDKIIPGPTLSPAYGSFIASYPIYSERLGTFGGGAAPNQAIHGTNQPELIGQRVSSGNIRVENEVMTFLVEQDLLGAYVVVFDSSRDGGRQGAIARLENKPWTPARTTEPTNTAVPITEPLF